MAYDSTEKVKTILERHMCYIANTEVNLRVELCTGSTVAYESIEIVCAKCNGRTHEIKSLSSRFLSSVVTLEQNS